jgi:acyl-CoA synthetase (AMP-forming)/AMP-acid ligase II
MSPIAFLQKPLRWLEAISRYGGTIAGAPTFAYDLCHPQDDREDRARPEPRDVVAAPIAAEPIPRQHGRRVLPYVRTVRLSPANSSAPATDSRKRR